jgi:hypothetical protein
MVILTFSDVWRHRCGTGRSPGLSVVVPPSGTSLLLETFIVDFSVPNIKSLDLPDPDPYLFVGLRIFSLKSKKNLEKA